MSTTAHVHFAADVKDPKPHYSSSIYLPITYIAQEEGNVFTLTHCRPRESFDLPWYLSASIRAASFERVIFCTRVRTRVRATGIVEEVWFASTGLARTSTSSVLSLFPSPPTSPKASITSSNKSVRFDLAACDADTPQASAFIHAPAQELAEANILALNAERADGADAVEFDPAAHLMAAAWVESYIPSSTTSSLSSTIAGSVSSTLGSSESSVHTVVEKKRVHFDDGCSVKYVAIRAASYERVMVKPKTNRHRECWNGVKSGGWIRCRKGAVLAGAAGYESALVTKW